MPGSRFIDLLDTRSDRDYVSNQTRGARSNKQHSPFHSDVYSTIQNHPQKEIAKIPHSFSREEYPLDFTQVNPFCPLCGKHVGRGIPFLAFQSQQRRKKYLAHDSCIQGNEGRVLGGVECSEARLQSIAFLNHMRSIALGGK